MRQAGPRGPCCLTDGDIGDSYKRSRKNVIITSNIPVTITSIFTSAINSTITIAIVGSFRS